MTELTTIKENNSNEVENEWEMVDTHKADSVDAVGETVEEKDCSADEISESTESFSDIIKNACMRRKSKKDNKKRKNRLKRMKAALRKSQSNAGYNDTRDEDHVQTMSESIASAMEIGNEDINAPENEVPPENKVECHEEKMEEESISNAEGDNETELKSCDVYNQNENTESDKDEVRKAMVHKKGDKLLYRRKSETMYYPPILVKVVGVHHDDFPNVYYTISCCPLTEQMYKVDEAFIFEERQTDNKYLFPIEHTFDDCRELLPPTAKETDDNVGNINPSPEVSPTSSCSFERTKDSSDQPEFGGPEMSSCPRTISSKPLGISIREFNEYYLLNGSAPGVSADGLQVTIEGHDFRTLKIKGYSRTMNVNLEQEVTFPVHFGVDLANSQVLLKNGTLSIRIPKDMQRPKIPPAFNSYQNVRTAPFGYHSQRNNYPFSWGWDR